MQQSLENNSLPADYDVGANTCAHTRTRVCTHTCANAPSTTNGKSTSGFTRLRVHISRSAPSIIFTGLFIAPPSHSTISGRARNRHLRETRRCCRPMRVTLSANGSSRPVRAADSRPHVAADRRRDLSYRGRRTARPLVSASRIYRNEGR